MAVIDKEETAATWTEEEFEDEINASLISLYEDKLVGQKKNHPNQRIDDVLLHRMRRIGLYMPEPQRLVVVGAADEYYTLPQQAALSLNASWFNRERVEKDWVGYRVNFYLEQIERLPVAFERTGGGQLYRLVRACALNQGGTTGDVAYFSVDKHHAAHPCQLKPHPQWHNAPRAGEDTVNAATATLNYWSDKRHCWTILAQEKVARAAIGVEREQVKSLLYARSLPLTATGRKRPILHLVAAHRRRIKEGIDIKIDEFLRGTRQVEMNGTLFTVNPPQDLLQKLGKE